MSDYETRRTEESFIGMPVTIRTRDNKKRTVQLLREVRGNIVAHQNTPHTPDYPAISHEYTCRHIWPQSAQGNEDAIMYDVLEIWLSGRLPEPAPLASLIYEDVKTPPESQRIHYTYLDEHGYAAGIEQLDRLIDAIENQSWWPDQIPAVEDIPE